VAAGGAALAGWITARGDMPAPSRADGDVVERRADAPPPVASEPTAAGEAPPDPPSARATAEPTRTPGADADAPLPPAPAVPPPLPPADAEERARLEARVAGLLGEVEERDRMLGRLRGQLAARSAAEELLAAPGVRVLPVVVGVPLQDVRGHAVWRPGAARLVTWLFGLPPLPPGGRWTFCVERSDGAPVLLSLGDRAPTATVTVPLDGGSAERVVLGWSLPEARGRE
jgi:hypothetical protein